MSAWPFQLRSITLFLCSLPRPYLDLIKTVVHIVALLPRAWCSQMGYSHSSVPLYKLIVCCPPKPIHTGGSQHAPIDLNVLSSLFPSLSQPSTSETVFPTSQKQLRLQGASFLLSPLFVRWVMQVSTFLKFVQRLSRAERVQSIMLEVINSCYRPVLWSTDSWLQLLLLMMRHQESCLYLNFPFQFSDFYWNKKLSPKISK